MTGRPFQIVWRWKAAHVPEGESIRWHFVAHGATWQPAKEREAAELESLIRSHGKLTRRLPL